MQALKDVAMRLGICKARVYIVNLQSVQTDKDMSTTRMEAKLLGLQSDKQPISEHGEIYVLVFSGEPYRKRYLIPYLAGCRVTLKESDVH